MDEQSAGAAESRTTSRLVVDVVRALRGWVVIAAGAVLLLSCYLGVSGETDPGLQLPFVVSGGFGGLALVLVGCALLIADRLESTRSGRTAAGQAGQARLAAQVDDLHALVVTAANAAPAAPAGVATVPAPAGPVGPATQSVEQPVAADDTSVYAVPGGRTFHRPGCELLAGKAAQRVEASQVAGRGLSPCSVCAPILVG